MIMLFNVLEAYEQLITHGVVYTIRPSIKQNGIHRLHINNWFTMPFEYGQVSFVERINNTKQLDQYVKQSGFKTVDKWIAEVKDRKYMYLHRVTLNQTG